MSKSQPAKAQTPTLVGRLVEEPALGTDQQTISVAEIFGPKFDGPYIPHQIVLRSKEACRLIRRDYYFLSRMLNTLTVSRDYRAVDHPALNAIEDSVATRIKNVRELVNTRLTALAKLMSAYPTAKAESRFAKAYMFEVPVASPHAFQYLELLAEADEYYNRGAAAYLQGVTGKAQAHFQEGREVWKAMVAIKIQISHARMECWKMLDRAKASAEPGSAEAAQLSDRVRDEAAQLLADDNSQEARDKDLTITQERDLQAAVHTPSDAGAVTEPAGTEASTPAAEPATADVAAPETPASKPGKKRADAPAPEAASALAPAK